MSEDPILASWQANARQWIATVEGAELESRRLVTNQAIVDAIVHRGPATVLDVGCGEGWLTRDLSRRGVRTVGVDAIPDFISYARQQGEGAYEVSTYQDLIQGVALPLAPYGGVVVNFALLDQKTTENLIPALARYLTETGWLFVQTLHPTVISVGRPYRSEWRPGSWDGMKREFAQPYRWYFRTLADWLDLFFRSGYVLRAIREPLHPRTEQPASIIFELQRDPM